MKNTDLSRYTTMRDKFVYRSTPAGKPSLTSPRHTLVRQFQDLMLQEHGESPSSSHTPAGRPIPGKRMPRLRAIPKYHAMFSRLFRYDIEPGHVPKPDPIPRQLDFDRSGKVEGSGGPSHHIEDWELGNTIEGDIGYGLTRRALTYSTDHRFLQTDSDALCAFATACQVLYSVYYHELNDWCKKMLDAYLVGTNKYTIVTSEDMDPRKLDQRPEVMSAYNALFIFASNDAYVPMSCPHILCALFNCTHNKNRKMAFAFTRPGAPDDWIDQDTTSRTLYLEDAESSTPTLLRADSASGIVPLNLETAEIPMTVHHVTTLATMKEVRFSSRVRSDFSSLMQNMRSLEFAKFTTKRHRATIIRILNKPDEHGKQWSHFISCVRKPNDEWLWFDPGREFEGMSDKYVSQFQSVQDMYYVFDLSA